MLEDYTIQDVRQALALPRPGWKAQTRMMPSPPRGEMAIAPPEYPNKQAGVLILLFKRNDAIRFILTRRTETVGTHKGQISLPGGSREGAERLDETACRESSEELGIGPEQIEILGQSLTPLYIPVSDFWVTAYVGRWVPFDQEPIFQPASDEVVELLEPTLDDLVDDSLIAEEDWERRGQIVRVPFFQFDGHKVWGATAMMLSEFRSMLKSQREIKHEFKSMVM